MSATETPLPQTYKVKFNTLKHRVKRYKRLRDEFYCPAPILAQEEKSLRRAWEAVTNTPEAKLLTAIFGRFEADGPQYDPTETPLEVILKE
jgi:hypothetical protein